MRYAKIAVILVFTAVTGCVSGAGKKADSQATDPKAIMGIEWFLLEIQTAEGVINIDRDKLAAEQMGDVFTIRFSDDNRVSGKAAPNRYSAPCQWGGGKSLSTGLAAVTRMMALKEPEALKEQEFLDYIAAIDGWSINAAGRLELHCSTAAVLVFSR